MRSVTLFLFCALCVPLSARAGVHVTVHADPGHATVDNAKRLRNLVLAADDRGHKLTILLGSTWVDLLASKRGGRNLLRDAALNGHKLGFHHHDCSHVSPDGTLADALLADAAALCSPGFVRRESVVDSYASVLSLQAALVASGVPDTPIYRLNISAQGPNEGGIFRMWEWHPNAAFATGTIEDNGDGHPHAFITQSRCAAYSNDGGVVALWDVPELGHQQLDVGTFTAIGHTLEELDEELAAVFRPVGDHFGEPVHLGVVLHAREYDPSSMRDDGRSDRDYIDAVFDTLLGFGVTAQPADALLRADAPCAL